MIAKALLYVLIGTIMCTSAFAQSTGGSGSGGGGLRSRNVSVAARKPACREGNRTLFYERGSDGDRQIQVFRTCQNGSYYDLSDYIYNPKIKCREGRREIWSEQDPHGDGTTRATYVCRNNKWVPANY